VTRGTGTTGIVLTEGTSLGEDDAYVTASGLGNALLRESPLFPGAVQALGGRRHRKVRLAIALHAVHGIKPL
jgi:hypothetical protein